MQSNTKVKMENVELIVGNNQRNNCDYRGNNEKGAKL